MRWPVVIKLFKICENFSQAKTFWFSLLCDAYNNYNFDASICNVYTGSPHIRLEQTTFIGRVLCRLFFTTRAERALC